MVSLHQTHSTVHSFPQKKNITNYPKTYTKKYQSPLPHPHKIQEELLYEQLFFYRDENAETNKKLDFTISSLAGS